MAALEAVTFMSDGLKLAGHLRVPDDTGGPWPCLVFTGPFTAVKEQVTGTYAELLTRSGYVTLTFDHRNFGESEGEPRQHEDGAGKLADLRDAVSFLATRAEADPGRLGCVGICAGGGYGLRFSAFDPRVKAVALIAGGYNDPKITRAGMGAANYRQQMATFAEVAQRQFATGEIEYIRAVAGDDGEVVMRGEEPFEYYGTERAACPGWMNRTTRLSVRELLTFDSALGADFISPTPMLMIHGHTDLYCSPDIAQIVYDRAGEPKELMWLDTTNHIDLYDEPRYVEPAAARAAAWFDAYL